MDREAWEEFLEELCQAVGGVAAGLVMRRSGDKSIVITVGMTTELGQDHPWKHVYDDAPIGQARLIEPPTEREVRASPYYRRVMAPQGLSWGPCIGVPLSHEDTAASSYLQLAPFEGRRLGAEEVSLLQQLSPHLVRAREIHMLLARKTAAIDGMRAVADRLLLGILLLDGSDRPVFANRSACELVGVEDGRNLTDGDRLRVRRWVTSSLGRRLEAAGQRGAEAIVARHPLDGRPLQVLASPLAPGADPIILGVEISSAIFVGDPKRDPGSCCDRLHELYGLSPGEAKLAQALSSDLSLEEAAELLEIKLSTARTRLKRVFAKTGTRRQASLVRLIHAAPALLRPDESEQPDRSGERDEPAAE